MSACVIQVVRHQRIINVPQAWLGSVIVFLPGFWFQWKLDKEIWELVHAWESKTPFEKRSPAPFYSLPRKKTAEGFEGAQLKRVNWCQATLHFRYNGNVCLFAALILSHVDERDSAAAFTSEPSLRIAAPLFLSGQLLTRPLGEQKTREKVTLNESLYWPRSQGSKIESPNSSGLFCV